MNADTAPYRILLVDDDSLTGLLLRRMFQDETDLELEECADPAQAIRMMDQTAPDVVLLDWVMPNIDGIQLLEQIKAHPEHRRLPALMISGQDDPQFKAQAFEKGAHDFLVKLPDKTELLARLRRHAELHRLRLESRRAEAALKLSKDHFQGMVEAMQMVPWEADPIRERFTYVGPQAEEILGFPPEMWTDFSFWKSHIHPDDRDAAFGLFSTMTAQGADHAFEFRFNASESQIAWIRCMVTVGCDDNNKPVVLRGAFQDITGRKSIERELILAKRESETANQAKNAFLAAMSHEIRTPISGVLGMVELLQGSSLSHKQRQWIDAIAQSGQSLLGIINDILDFSKIETGKLELEISVFNLHTLCRETVELFQVPAQQNRNTLTFHASADLPDNFRGDALRLRQIIINLLSNAVKFTHGGQITLEAAPEEAPGRVALTVRDSGIGIEPKKLDQLFLPFNQAHNQPEKYRGAGLGLSITRRLTHLMNGDIKAESQPGRGSVFTVSLPLSRAGETDAAPEPQIASGPALPTGARLLLVDDDSINQMVVDNMLKRSGLEPTVADNGETALKLLEEERFDLVLLDCQMPGMDGFELCRLFRKMEQARGEDRIPVVALTAYAMAGVREQCMAAGMDDYLAKPVRGNELKGTLLRWLGSAQEAALPGAEAAREAPVLDNAVLGELASDAPVVAEGFLDRLPFRIRKIAWAIQGENPQEVEKAGHTLKTAARQVGAERLSLTAGRMESLGAAEDLTEAPTLLQQLERESQLTATAIKTLLQPKF